jgi:SAM-dependent methyltransferase
VNHDPAPGWSRLFEKRYEIHKRHPSIWKVPLLRKRFPLICSVLEPAPGKPPTVLDVGAAERTMEARLRARFPGLVYKSLDVDPEGKHDYRSFDEVREPFDLVVLLEVIEHLTLEEGSRMLDDILKVLRPGGRLIVSTPNICHPWRYWVDATHRTPYSYENIGGLLLVRGFRVEALYRSYNASLLERAGRTLLTPIHRALDIDYAKSIFVVAAKP